MASVLEWFKKWRRPDAKQSASGGLSTPPAAQAATELGPLFEYRPSSFRGFTSEQMRRPAAPGASGLAQADSAFVTGYFQTARERFAAERAVRKEHYTVVYASRAASADQPHAQLRDLRDSCAMRNFQAGLCSALVLQDGMFCQWLAGDEAAVRAVLSRIKRDDRHSAFMTLYRGMAPVTLLDAWSMGTRSLYMPQGDAFQRAQRLRIKANLTAYATPQAAWLDFTGATLPEHAEGLQATALPDVAAVADSVALVGLRSAFGGQLLLDGAKGRQTGLVVSRWGAAADLDCDLQTVEAVLPIGPTPAHVLSLSARSLRVGVLRESLRHCKRWVFVLTKDDVAELDQLINLVQRNTPPDLMPERVDVVAPTWAKPTALHAQHVLDTFQWRGKTHTVEPMRKGAWNRLAETLAS